MLYALIIDILSKNNSLESRKRVVALLQRSWKKPGRDIAVLKSPPNAIELTAAENLILASGMFETSEALLQGKVASLLRWPYKGKGRGQHQVQAEVLDFDLPCVGAPRQFVC